MITTEEANVGKCVARFRGERSQQWVADAMRERGWKWAQATTYNVEQGKRPLKFVEARDLAALLGVAVMDLFGDPDVVAKQNELRAWADFVSESYDGAGVNLVSLFDALQGLRGTIETADDERLTAHVQQAKDALTMTPGRALKEAQKLHALPLGAR